MLDRNYRYLIVNDAYESFSGINREQFIGLTVAEYLGVDVFEKHIKPHFDRCLQGEVVNYQEWFEYPTLGKKFIDVSYYPYRDSSSNRITSVIVNCRDITERKQAEKALKISREKLLEEHNQKKYYPKSLSNFWKKIIIISLWSFMTISVKF